MGCTTSSEKYVERPITNPALRVQPRIKYLMESAKESVRIGYDDYMVTVVRLSDQKLSVHVVSRSTGEVFEDKSLVLSRLNYQVSSVAILVSGASSQGRKEGTHC